MPYKTPEKRREARANRALEKVEAERQAKKKYYLENKDRLLKKQSEYSKSGLRSIQRKKHYAENAEKIREKSRQYRHAHWIEYALYDAEKRAIRKGLPFDLKPEDLEMPECCPIFGVPLVIAGGDNSPSIDRIDSKLGYVRGNVWIISDRANRIKRDATADELFLIASAVKAKLGTR